IYKIDNSFGSGLVFNSGSKAVRWLQNIKAAADTGAYGITNGAVDRVLDLVFIHCRYGHRAADFMASLDNWRSTPNLPEDLLPPGPDGWGVVRQ
ncbi:MAG: hypothetical protein Q7K37_12435, partial [Dehalococcoidia bacterium]|nr:hypothetical protein [Dehalococcoidia bacterium]